MSRDRSDYDVAYSAKYRLWRRWRATLLPVMFVSFLAATLGLWYLWPSFNEALSQAIPGERCTVPNCDRGVVVVFFLLLSISLGGFLGGLGLAVRRRLPNIPRMAARRDIVGLIKALEDDSSEGLLLADEVSRSPTFGAIQLDSTVGMAAASALIRLRPDAQELPENLFAHASEEAIRLLGRAGDAWVVGPLLTAAEHAPGERGGAEAVRDALREALARHMPQIATADLQRAAALPDYYASEWVPYDGSEEKIGAFVSYSGIRDLARQELVRRGVVV